MAHGAHKQHDVFMTHGAHKQHVLLMGMTETTSRMYATEHIPPRKATTKTYTRSKLLGSAGMLSMLMSIRRGNTAKICQ